MTLNWLEWLFEKGERNSRCYDFIEARPVWTMWWFRIGVVLAGICVTIAWLLWPRFG